MKRNQVTLAVLLAGLSFLAAPSVSALPQSQAQAIKRIVADVPAAELAAKAADLVTQASKVEQQEVAIATVREVASKRPATILAVVGAIAKSVPELSPVVAAEAAKLVGEKSTEIAKVAASAAPAQADRIAAAVAAVAPKSAAKVARSVVLVVPDQTSRIVESVVKVVPASKTDIQKDVTITRLTDRMGSSSGNSGVIVTLPGSISGAPVPTVPPTDAGTPTAGADPGRKPYGSP
jgi:hypothetical protein